MPPQQYMLVCHSNIEFLSETFGDFVNENLRCNRLMMSLTDMVPGGPGGPGGPGTPPCPLPEPELLKITQQLSITLTKEFYIFIFHMYGYYDYFIIAYSGDRT